MAADFGEPYVQFVLFDSPIASGVSSVDCALKRFLNSSDLWKTSLNPLAPSGCLRSRIVRVPNREDSRFDTPLGIARGVARRFPFRALDCIFHGRNRADYGQKE